MSNALERILARFEEDKDGVQEKTASAETSPEKTAEARMLETVRKVSESVQEKTAADSTDTPTANLERMAKQAQDAEQELLTKEAKSLGAAVCDGFMERYAAYDEAISKLTPKTASAVVPGGIQAVEKRAYAQARADLEKEAEEQYAQGYRDQLNLIHKTASEIHYAGQAVAHNIVNQIKGQK